MADVIKEFKSMAGIKMSIELRNVEKIGEGFSADIYINGKDMLDDFFFDAEKDLMYYSIEVEQMLNQLGAYLPEQKNAESLMNEMIKEVLP